MSQLPLGIIISEDGILAYARDHKWCFLPVSGGHHAYITPQGNLLEVEISGDSGRVLRINTVDHITLSEMS